MNAVSRRTKRRILRCGIVIACLSWRVFWLTPLFDNANNREALDA
jgi:hypothetical protein